MEASTLLKRHGLQLALLGAPLILIAAAWNRFPERVVNHWDIHGRPNGWSGKGIGLLVMPILNIGFALLLYWIPQLDPKLRRESAANERIGRVIGIMRLTLTAFLAFFSILLAVAALGYPIAIGRVTVDASLILMVVLGNYMGTLRPNYFIGIRNPWTLENPEVWRLTHRIGGRVLVFGSLVLLLMQFALTELQLTIGFLAFLVGTAIWTLIFSYRCYRHLVQ
jgi:uncharacterized membrane protein